MRVKLFISVFAILTILSGVVHSDPFDIIIITSGSTESERGYTEFLQNIYKGNVHVHIDPDRYDENLSENKKSELESADLFIISRDASNSDYDDDAEFWNEVNVPILNHNIKLARSDGHTEWDWLDGSDTISYPLTYITVADANDEIFTGIDTSGGTVDIYATSTDIDYSDQGLAGYGTVVATSDGNVVIARWLGSEPNYYDGSYYAPNSPRIFFAMPKMTYEFFDNSTDDGKQVLENAIMSLLPVIRPTGDLDDDGDVDFDDFSVFSGYWMDSGLTCRSPIPPSDSNVTMYDLKALTENWLVGADGIPPEPNIMTWQTEPMTTTTQSIYMAATVAIDLLNGVQYYFECESGNGPDSDWQYNEFFEPNGLASGTKYTYKVKAGDTSGNFNETQWSNPKTTWTFEIYREIADASAAAVIDANLFVVGDDEDNRLCIYDSNNPASASVADANVGQFLNVDPCHPETDIEGATWFGDKIFWITSHGRNKDGKYWYSRYQFFAMTITKVGQDFNVTVEGNYTSLVDDLIAYDLVYNLGLIDAIGVIDSHIDPNEIPDLAPKKDGLNIEGLCTSAEGDSMFIGFRNPRPEVNDVKYALIIELYNPEEVVLSGEPADFGPPILLDLDNLGIRSMEYSPTPGEYLIVAGSHKSTDEKPLQILYRYDMTTGILTEMEDFPIITPEAMFQFPDSNDIQLLSDDGTLLIETGEGPVINKLLPRELRTFRSQTFSP